MSHSAPSRVREDLLARLAEDPPRTAILTDVDGTIAPIAERPEGVVVPDAARRALEGLAERYALVACVSGRRATDARRLVGVEGITYSGNHGLETLSRDGGEVRFDLSLRGHEDAAACFIDAIDVSLLESSGLRREDKGPIQALHWRGSPSEAEARQQAEKIASEAVSAGLTPHWGRKVLEIRPHGGAGKGAAIESLLEDGQDRVRLAAYAGDDRTDLDAFSRLHDLADEGGPIAEAIRIGILSSEGPPGLAEASDFVLDGPEDWIEVLDRLGG